MLIIITFYSGELVWRERDARTHELVDALPLPTWVCVSAKLVALLLVHGGVELRRDAYGHGDSAAKGTHTSSRCSISKTCSASS